MNTVTPSAASAKRSQIGAASNGAKRASAPAHSAPSAATTRPCVWCSGSTCSRRSSARHPQAVSSDASVAATAACESRTPLGRPVVPEV